MKHAIQRYPEVEHNQDFVNLIVATLTAPTDFNPILLEVTGNDHRAGTISAYLHSNLDHSFMYRLFAESGTTAKTISERTGLFCDCKGLLQPYNEMYHTSIALNLSEQIPDDPLLKAAIQTLFNSSNRAVLITCGIIKNADKACYVAGKKYRTRSQLLELLEPTHSFMANGSLVMAWFK